MRSKDAAAQAGIRRSEDFANSKEGFIGTVP